MVSASHKLSRCQRQHVTISWRLRMTQLLIWCTPLWMFNNVTQFFSPQNSAANNILTPNAPSSHVWLPTPGLPVFHIPTAHCLQQQTGVPEPSTGSDLYNVKQSLALKLIKLDENHIFDVVWKRCITFSKWGFFYWGRRFNLFRDALSDEHANALESLFLMLPKLIFDTATSSTHKSSGNERRAHLQVMTGNTSPETWWNSRCVFARSANRALLGIKWLPWAWSVKIGCWCWCFDTRFM